MLDTDTKRRIDTARDILVGKVPDPKSQVEQITIALIYKFMDDIDAESEEFGGKRSFFAGEYARYGWTKLMRSGLGGHETLNLYAEAITTMPENPGIPPLFRDIFKNAYLPYRDPETLRAFLKTIDEFTYDHSERLGDAFEYLLSVLGSQGAAGQFRTPRHIIDFIVGILEPKKGETVLDPACGTAGFLISSYKHILAANIDPQGASTLTPDDKGRLAANFKGYDISPDMVRLSLVNMYLHGFTDPHIFEYDTLTSEERWNEYADVILANPPFMSPKGGIRPHNRFSVKSKRSEVLFVDYMAEHLMPSGRAGIIVPEGIIFQSQNAYKQLRKMLVEEYLVAVVSLPAGVFNPYSGVKTSILILDKSLAKKTDRAAFFKVESDGFDLGAQRREIDKDDLPQVQAEIGEYLSRLRAGETLTDFEPTQGLIVEKGKIASDKDYNLSGQRYRDRTVATSNFPIVPLSELAKVKNGFAFKSKEYVSEGLRVLRIKNVQEGEVIDDDPKFIALARRKEFTDFALKSGDILMSLTGNVGRVGRLKPEHEPAVLNQRVAHICPYEDAHCLPEFLFPLLNTDKFKSDAVAASSGIAQANLSSKWVGEYQIPLPPLEVQKEIVAEIKGYQKVIDGARAVVDNYRPHIPIDPAWPMVTFGDVTKTITPPIKLQTCDFKDKGSYPIVDQSQVAIAGRTDDKNVLVDGRGGLVIFGDHTCAVKFMDEKFAQGADGIKIIKAGESLEPKFIYFYLLSHPIGQEGYKRHFGKLKELRTPVPPLEIQRAIVTELEAEQAIVNANRELIVRFEKKISEAIDQVWGDAEPDTVEA